MKCKQCISLVLEQPNRDMSDDESRMLAEHLNRCADCLAFKNELQAVSGLMKAIRAPELSSELDEKTREKCHGALRKAGTIKETAETSPRLFGLPRGILASLFLLVAITLVLVFPTIGELSFKETLSAGEMFTLMLILQNAVMLLFSPVLFRKYSRITFKTFREVKNG